MRTKIELHNRGCSIGTQSHVLRQLDAIAHSSAAASLNGSSQNTLLTIFPDIDEIDYVHCLGQNLHYRYSIRLMTKNELHRSHHFSALFHCYTKDEPRHTVPSISLRPAWTKLYRGGCFAAAMCLKPYVNYMQCALFYLKINSIAFELYMRYLSLKYI